MKSLLIVIVLIALPSASSARVFFPLHPNNYWVYDSHSFFCEGVSIASAVVRDTAIGARVYAICQFGSPFRGSYLRADSSRVYEYDSSSHSEFVVLDFNANPGDTVCFWNNGLKIIVALGNMRFDVGPSIITIRDSIGIVVQEGGGCTFTLRFARINGNPVTLHVNYDNQSSQRELLLEQNYPNPFNPLTSFRFFIPTGQSVSIRVYNSLGEEIETLHNGHISDGWHTIAWHANGHSSGVYFCVLRTRQSIVSRKLILLQ